jgi:hypothetical protein
MMSMLGPSFPGLLPERPWGYQDAGLDSYTLVTHLAHIVPCCVQ